MGISDAIFVLNYVLLQNGKKANMKNYFTSNKTDSLT